MTREQLTPDASHPITVTPTGGTVRVTAGGSILAESRNALTMRESTHPAVQYVPISDIDAAALRHTDTTTYCPFKGEAAYYTLDTEQGELTDAAWTYPAPYAAVAEIRDHLAFYPDRVSISVEG